MRFLPCLLLAVTVVIGGISCRKSAASDSRDMAADEVVKKASELSREMKGELASLLGRLKQALDSGELAKAKEVGRQIDAALSQRVIGWYLDVLKTEELEGIEAAKEQLRSLKETENATVEERRALEIFEAYFREKGRIKTKEAFAALAELYLRAKLEELPGILPHN